MSEQKKVKDKGRYSACDIESFTNEVIKGANSNIIEGTKPHSFTYPSMSKKRRHLPADFMDAESVITYVVKVAKNNDITSIMHGVESESSSIFDFFVPRAPNGFMSIFTSGTSDDMDTEITKPAHVSDKDRESYPLFSALNAFTGLALNFLLSYEPKMFLKQYGGRLARCIYANPWREREKIMALEALIEQGVPLKENGTPLTKERLRVLFDFEQAPFDIYKHYSTALTATIHNNNAVNVALMLYLKPDLISYKYDNGDTLLIMAARNGKLDAVKILLAHGVSLTETDRNGHTALWIAAMKGHHQLVEHLIIHYGAADTGRYGDGAEGLRRIARVLIYGVNGHTRIQAEDPAGSVFSFDTPLGTGNKRVEEKVAALKALYDSAHKKQIEAALGGSSPLVISPLRQIIEEYDALFLGSDPTSPSAVGRPLNSTSEVKSTTPPDEIKSNKTKESQPLSAAEIAKILNAPNPGGPSFKGWGVSGEGAVNTFDTAAARAEAQTELAPHYREQFDFRALETNITTTSSTPVTSYHLYASVKKGLQTSTVAQLRSSASTNGVANLHSNTAGSFAHPRSLLATEPPATGNNTVASSSTTSTGSATPEQQPVEQDGSELSL